MSDFTERLTRAHTGDEKAREELILENRPLVYAVVKRFEYRGYDREELFQIGMIGLMKAIDRFDTKYEVAFSTYAVPLITGELKRFFRDNSMMKVSRGLKEQGYHIAKAREKIEQEKIKKQKLPEHAYNLRQVPNVDGGLIAVDPHTGRVLAMVGGYSYKRSQFNRATQARRQTGSSFKPFVYLCALENGYSPTDLILDAPFVLDQGAGLPKWKPENFTKKFYGLMTLREGIEKSRNLMTVRLAQDVGMDKISAFAKKVGINDRLPELLSMSLGAGETRLIDLTSAYAEIVNGGKKIKPYLIERVQDRYGRTILKQDNRDCVGCNYDRWENQPVPELVDNREQLFDDLSAYQMTSILEGVATRGSGARLRRLKKHLGGKTGTTNDSKEGWFVGFSPDLVVGTYIGFDEPRSLGRWETGASLALPVFYAFMEEALKDQPDIPFRIPAGIKLVRINYKTGKPAVPGDEVVITEALKPDFSFEKAGQRIINGSSDTDNGEETNERDNFKNFGNSADSESFQLGTQY